MTNPLKLLYFYTENFHISKNYSQLMSLWLRLLLNITNRHLSYTKNTPIHINSCMRGVYGRVKSSVVGSDSSGGVGIQSDVKNFETFALFGPSAESPLEKS